MRQFEISTAEYRVWLKGYEEGYNAGRNGEIAWREMKELEPFTYD